MSKLCSNALRFPEIQTSSRGNPRIPRFFLFRHADATRGRGKGVLGSAHAAAPSDPPPRMTDRPLLYAAAFVRALATGMIGVLMGVYLARLEFTPAGIGSIIGAGLLGCTAAALLVTCLADRAGRRRSLICLSLLSAAGGLAFGLTSHPAAAAVAAFIGMVNGMGRDRGASLILDQAILPATVDGAHRTRAFAWYNVLQDIGHALGGLLAGTPALLRRMGVEEVASFRLSVGLYALLQLACAVLYLALSRRVEPQDGAPRARVSPGTRRVLWRISSLFALDSLAGGFLTTALLSFFFYERFGVSEASWGRCSSGRGCSTRCPIWWRRGCRGGSAWSTPWSSRTSRPVCCSSPSPTPPASRSRRSCFSCARDWWRWTCRRGSPTSWRWCVRRSARSPPA
ncbi:MAG: hypothetical protein DMF51_05750 [Acidobacteria bacterium]|nr:MAG: hypothetical protein DMF51_05750 [Acidobacteriota bacterium]